ncbi:hypothetical protein GCM10009414_31880 [Tatumella terrea]
MLPRIMDMNKLQTEQLLRNEGFTGKEILMLRRHAEKEGNPYCWLLSQLKIRFIISMVIILMSVAGLIYSFCYNNQQNTILSSVAFLFFFGILYVFIPLKPACKAYRFMKKHGRSL